MLLIYLWEIFVNLIENTIVAYLLFHRLTLRNSKYYIAMFTGFVLFSSILVSYCNFHQINTTTTLLALFLFRMIFIFLCFRNTFSEKTFTCCLPSFMSIFADQITYTIALIVSASNLSSFDFLGDNRVVSTLLFLLFIFLFMIAFLHILNDISSLPKKFDVFVVIT